MTIISLQKVREMRFASSESSDLNGLLNRATFICKENLNFSQDKLRVVREGNLKDVFDGKCANNELGYHMRNQFQTMMAIVQSFWWRI
jgi:hypothetical protein